MIMTWIECVQKKKQATERFGICFVSEVSRSWERIGQGQGGEANIKE